jgi:hypothetical protein
MSSPVDHIRVTLDGIGAETFLIFPLLDYIPHPHAQTKLDTVGHMEPRGSPDLRILVPIANHPRSDALHFFPGEMRKDQGCPRLR